LFVVGHVGAPCIIEEQGREGENDEVQVTMEILIACGLTLDNVDGVGDDVAALFRSSAALINFEATPGSDVVGPNNHDSLTSTTVH